MKWFTLSLSLSVLVFSSIVYIRCESVIRGQKAFERGCVATGIEFSRWERLHNGRLLESIADLNQLIALQRVQIDLLNARLQAPVPTPVPEPEIVPARVPEPPLPSAPLFQSPESPQFAQEPPLRIPSDEEIDQLESASLDECDPHAAGTFGALPPRDAWMSEFTKTRRAMVKTHPLCQACGRSPEEIKQSNDRRFGQIDMHHMISVKRIIEENLDRKLLTSAENMVMLCRDEHGGCHLKYGHTIDGHASWSHSNPNVARDVKNAFATTWPGWTYEELVANFEASRSVEKAKVGDESGVKKDKGSRGRARQKKTIIAP